MSFTFIDGTDEEDINYCRRCERVNLKIKLGPRIYDEDQPLPYDADEWMQCPNCGTLVPIYEVKQEGEYVPIVDLIDNPFDSGSEFHGVEKRKPHNRLNDYTDEEENDK